MLLLVALFCFYHWFFVKLEASMQKIERYTIWNNKGGVGKSTITFHVATRYAERNPHKRVLVIDLCPQSNSSMMLLGGGTIGEAHVMSFCIQPVPRTVVGYMSTVIANGPGALLPQPLSYMVNLAGVNGNMPPNLDLLCGDANLEPMSPAITAAANAAALTPTVQPWKWVHLVFRKLVDSYAACFNTQDVTVFIDTNPSFSIYTELAISAGDKLIVPVNADDSSRVATNALFILLHGQTPPHPIYGSWTYASNAARYNLAIPQIHAIVGNRLTQHLGAAIAFSALSDATANTLYQAYQANPVRFTYRQYLASTLDEFRRYFTVALRDFNTAGVVSAHLGMPLSRLTGGHYYIHGDRVQINNDRVTECSRAVDDLVSML